jgi:hypothetical protein
MVTAAS